MKRHIALIGLTLSLNACTGGGESVVSGFGNNDNYFGVNAEAAVLASVMSQHPNVPRVSDADLLAIYQVVREAALAGDIRSAVVLYKLAEKQRADKSGPE